MRYPTVAGGALCVALVVAVGGCHVAGQGEGRAGDHHFSAGVIDRLKTTDFGSFFGAAKTTFSDQALGWGFLSQRGYVAGAEVRATPRHVMVLVFESHDAALAAVEYRRKNVANVIVKGAKARDGIADWWFCESQALLSIVYGNIVFEAGDSVQRYSAVKPELWAAASAFMKSHQQDDRTQENHHR